MPEPGKSDRWNSLLETLGVPASEPKPAPPAAEAPASETPTAPAKPQPVSMLRQEKAKGAPKPPPAKPAAKSPSYWSRIAGALGLDVPAAPETPAEEPLRVPVKESKDQRTEEPKPPREEPRRERMEERRPRRTEESPPHEARRPQPAPREHEPRETEVREPELPSRAFQRPPREERPTRDERPAREVRPPRDERPPTREERPPTPRREERPRPSQPAPSSLGEMFGPKTPDMDVFGLTEEEAKAPRGRESSTPRARDLDESGSVLEYDQAEGSGSDLSLGAAPPRELGAKTDEEQDQDVPRRRRRRRGRGRRGTGESRGADEARGAGASREAASPRHEADIEPAGEEADFDFERDEELDLEAGVGRAPDATRDRPERGQRREREAEPDRYPPSAERAPREPGEERGGRPRRRRGRGPDRERDEAAPKRPAPYGTTDDEPERFGPPRDTRAPAARTTHDVDDEPDDDLHADIDDADEGQSGDVPTHRKIPTWDEAVGILIDANMASRANSPDRGRGRGRGRGR